MDADVGGGSPAAGASCAISSAESTAALGRLKKNMTPSPSHFTGSPPRASGSLGQLGQVGGDLGRRIVTLFLGQARVADQVQEAHRRGLLHP